MKNTIPILMLGIALMLASCSGDEDALQTKQTGVVTFTATLDGSMDLRASKTRGVTDPTDEAIIRAVLEIYDVQNNLVGDRINGTIDRDKITFTATTLEEDATYTCLFWADAGGTYDIKDLTAITPGWEPSIAYYAKKEITASSGPEVVTLTHAVAKIVMYETAGLNEFDQGGLEFKYPNYTFNVKDGNCTAVGLPINLSGAFTVTANETTGAVGSLYVFAPAEGAAPVTMKLFYSPKGGTPGGGTDVKRAEVSNVPLKLNHRTVVKGEFAAINGITQNFNVSLNKDWEGNFTTPATIGSYYYEGGLFSETYISSLTCLGVVFEVAPAGEHGKVVGLTENGNVAWASINETTGAIHPGFSYDGTATSADKINDSHPVRAVMAF